MYFVINCQNTIAMWYHHTAPNKTYTIKQHTKNNLTKLVIWCVKQKYNMKKIIDEIINF